MHWTFCSHVILHTTHIVKSTLCIQVNIYYDRLAHRTILALDLFFEKLSPISPLTPQVITIEAVSLTHLRTT